MDITRRMFNAANRYQDFSLDFEAKPGQNLEFRVDIKGGSFVKHNRTILR
jgi:hypothetical protein